jgi:hypothetical protein
MNLILLALYRRTKALRFKFQNTREYDYEGSMAKTLLQTICRNAEDIKNMLEDDENLPSIFGGRRETSAS